ncbi:MAG: DUF488 domain-containing protein [Candidatus Baltobacteraceae bacterium]
MTLYTIGHGTSPVDAFLESLRTFAIVSLVDVRRFPGSRHNPQYGSEALAGSLAASGIAYRNAVDLGGRRRANANSENTGLRNEAFRAYADYMETPEFASAFETLVNDAETERTVIMCSETVWWRCHRRLIADAAVLLKNRAVEHIVAGKGRPHILTEGASVWDRHLRYRPCSGSGSPDVRLFDA